MTSTTGLPDPQKWDFDVGGTGWGNRELQYYTEWREENARVENGMLIIEARQEEDWGVREVYISAINSKGYGAWTYGRIEVKAKLPSGRGTWPAIWIAAAQLQLSVNLYLPILALGKIEYSELFRAARQAQKAELIGLQLNEAQGDRTFMFLRFQKCKQFQQRQNFVEWVLRYR